MSVPIYDYNSNQVHIVHTCTEYTYIFVLLIIINIDQGFIFDKVIKAQNLFLWFVGTDQETCQIASVHIAYCMLQHKETF